MHLLQMLDHLPLELESVFVHMCDYDEKNQKYKMVTKITIMITIPMMVIVTTVAMIIIMVNEELSPYYTTSHRHRTKTHRIRNKIDINNLFLV